MIKAQRVFAEEEVDSLSEDDSETNLPPPPPPPPVTTVGGAAGMDVFNDVIARLPPAATVANSSKPFKPIDPSVLLASAEMGPTAAAFSNLTIGDRPQMGVDLQAPQSIESHLSFAPQMDATFTPTTSAKRVITSDYQV